MRRKQLQGLLDKLTPLLRQAFMESIGDIKSAAQLSAIAGHLASGNVAQALIALNLRPEFFAPLDDTIRAAYLEGGRAASAAIPAVASASGTKLAVRFDGRNARAEAWLSEHSSQLITEILEDQRIMAQAVLRQGMISGENSRTVARSLVGSMNKATGKREGGFIGLTSRQQSYVARAREQLATGDYAGYLSRKRRDRRYDSFISRALREDRPLTKSEITKMTSRYSDRLLALRGETIGRTEAQASIHASQDEAFRQLVDAEAVPHATVTRTWRTAVDSRTRDAHAEMEGETVGLDETFSNGLAYPGAPGPAEETINCRCMVEVKVDYLAGLQHAG